MVDVVLHAINYLKDKKEEYDVFVLLQPTSPLRQYTDIDRSIRKLFSKKADTVVAVAEVGHPPLWVNTLPPDGCMKKFLSTGVAGKGRQAFKRYYLPNGAVYAGLTDRLNKTRSFYTDKTFSHIMPRERAVDIDDATDLKLAELIMKDSLKR